MDVHAIPPSPRTVPTRARERVGYDRHLVNATLDEALVCHVGFVVDDHPVVLPHLHARVDETLYLHGSTGARALRTATDGGLDVCVTVTVLDGVVLARSAFHHSVNYRSVVIHGRALVVTADAEKHAALGALVEGIAPGRVAGSRPPSAKELAATTVLKLPLLEVSTKVRSGDPLDDPEDLGLGHWAGVVPVSLAAGSARPAADLEPGLDVPEHVRTWSLVRLRQP